MIHINADAITNSILNGVNTNTICTCEHEFYFFLVFINHGISQKPNVLYVERSSILKVLLSKLNAHIQKESVIIV